MLNFHYSSFIIIVTNDAIAINVNLIVIMTDYYYDDASLLKDDSFIKIPILFTKDDHAKI